MKDDALGNGRSESIGAETEPNAHSLFPSEWEGLSKKATATRDFVLVGAGVLYVVGFLVWSVYGFANNLGFLQLSYGQYIAAGVSTALGLYGFMLAYNVGFLCSGYIKVEDTKRKNFMFLAYAIGIPTVVAILEGKLRSALTIAGIQGIYFFIFGLSGILFLPERFLLIKRKSASSAPSALPSPWAYVASTIVLVYTGSIIISKVPQAFGGMKPRIAIIYMKSDDISAIVLRGLLRPNVAPGDNKVVATVPVDVLYDSDDTLEARPQGTSSEHTYEIKKDKVVAIDWNK
jgi:hypothetical protein